MPHYHPVDKQPQRPGQPTSQGAGSQGARALQQVHSVTVYPKLLEKEKQGSGNQRSLISLELLRLEARMCALTQERTVVCRVGLNEKAGCASLLRSEGPRTRSYSRSILIGQKGPHGLLALPSVTRRVPQACSQPLFQEWPRRNENS